MPPEVGTTQTVGEHLCRLVVDLRTSTLILFLQSAPNSSFCHLQTLYQSLTSAKHHLLDNTEVFMNYYLYNFHTRSFFFALRLNAYVEKRWSLLSRELVNAQRLVCSLYQLKGSTFLI